MQVPSGGLERASYCSLKCETLRYTTSFCVTLGAELFCLMSRSSWRSFDAGKEFESHSVGLPEITSPFSAAAPPPANLLTSDRLLPLSV